MWFVCVGDVHCVPNDIPDCLSLFNFLKQIRADNPQAHFLFLGDQHDSHDTLSVRVVAFWRQVFAELPSTCLTGNHDQSIPGQAPHAMDAYRDVCRVVWPTLQVGPLFLASYCKTPADFEARTANQDGLLVCHQDLAGFAYEDGFVTRSTLRPSDRFVQTISGHLHTPQERGNIWYPGSPRWRTRSDARVAERAVWLIEVAEDGRIISRRPYSTNGVCRRTVLLEDSAESPVQLIEGADCRVEVRGSVDYVARRREELKAQGAKVRAVVDRTKEVRVRESEGVAESFRKFFGQFHPPNGTNKMVLAGMVRERLGFEL